MNDMLDASATAGPAPFHWVRRNLGTITGATLCSIVILIAVAAPYLTSVDPNKQNLMLALMPPGPDHLLGTDQYGRDVLSRIIWGAQISVQVAVLSTLLAMIVGGIIGLISGYYGGWIDSVVMRVMDALLSFPTLIFGLIVVALIGSEVYHLIIAIALTSVAPFARIARAPVLSLKEQAFMEAGRALGFSDARLIFRHLLPNIVSQMLIMSSLWMASAVRTEASLAFVGLGVPPPTATWGGMMRDGFTYILEAPWLTIWPGLMILIFIMGLSILGDSLGDRIDTRDQD